MKMQREHRIRSRMSSKERLLSAINLEEADHIPLYLHLFESQNILPEELRWQSQFERIERFVEPLGLDDFLWLSAPEALDPSVKKSVRRETPSDERYPLLIKEYETSKGTLRQVVRQTSDWPYGDDIPLLSDHAVSRSREFLIKGPEDLESFRCLVAEPSDQAIRRFSRYAENVRSFAEKRGVAICGDVGSTGTTAFMLLGWNSIMQSMTQPDFFQELLDIIQVWQMRDLELLLEIGKPDIVRVNGFYETPALWSPKLYRRFFMPRFAEKIRLIHKAGVKCGYTMSTTVTPLLPSFRELGFDTLWYVDPVQGEMSLQRLKEEIGDRLCFLGGVNGALTVGHGTGEDIRKAVREAIQTLGPGGGLILNAADAIYKDAPWDNVISMIQAWREMGEYPLQP